MFSYWFVPPFLSENRGGVGKVIEVKHHRGVSSKTLSGSKGEEVINSSCHTRRPADAGNRTDLTNLAGTPQTGGTRRGGNDLGNTLVPCAGLPSAEDAIRGWGEQIRLGFKRSRNRLLQSVLAATAATSQRSGTALPGFIPRGVSPQAALQIATRIDASDRVLNTAVTLRSRDMIRRTIRNKCTVKTQRRTVIRQLKRVRLTLQPLRERLLESPPGTRTGAQT